MSNIQKIAEQSKASVTLKLVPIMADIPQSMVPTREFRDTTGFATFVWTIIGIAVLATALALITLGAVSFPKIAMAFPVDVLFILASLDLFSIFVVQTGALEAVGIRLALLTQGRADVAAMLMGMLMFTASAFLNNLAAIFILAPVFLTLLRAMRAPPAITTAFLSLMLVLCNLGGMATPMGDFPAIMLMSTGLIGFLPYLTGAFPLAATLALLAILFYSMLVRYQHSKNGGEREEATTRVALEMLRARHQYVRPDFVRAGLLGGVFLGMVMAWALIPPSSGWPFVMTAVTGVFAAALVAGPKLSGKAFESYNLRTAITMAVILTIAAFVSASGFVGSLANWIVTEIPNPTMLLMALMALVMLAAGVFSAGPATAAVLPIFIELSKGPLASYGDLLGVAFAASICAGSSMLLHSATAGPTLKGEAIKAGFIDEKKHPIWNNMIYPVFGLTTGLIQLVISMAWILGAANFEQAWLMNIIPVGLSISVVGLIIKGLGTDNHDQKNTRLSRILVISGLLMAIAGGSLPIAQILINL